jgi:uncharacterized protein
VTETGITRRYNLRVPLRDGITLAADVVLPEGRPAPALVMRTPYGRSGERQSARAEAFARVRYQHRIGELDLPVLHISGWYDDEEIGTPANFAAMTAAGRTGQRLLMGPWGHAVNTTRKLGEVDFGPDAMIDLDAYVLAFLDEHVRGIAPEPAPEPVRIFVMGAGQWRDEATWPPASAGTHVFHLASGGRANSRFGDGRLQAEPPVGDQAPDEWVHDPDRPVPFITGEGSGQIGGPDDYLGVESRGDVLVYSTEPLAEPVELIGPVTLVAHVATSAADTDITAKLVDVHPSGFAQRLCDGMVRLRYRHGFDRAEPVTPGQVYQVRIVMWDTCVRLDAGHRTGRGGVVRAAQVRCEPGHRRRHDHRNRGSPGHQPHLARCVAAVPADRQRVATRESVK